MDLERFVADVGEEGPVTIAGLSTRGGAVPDERCVRAPSGIDWIQADEMTVSCGAGTPVDDLSAALAELGQRTVLPPGGTVGGALATGRSGIRRLGDGPMRDALLQTRYAGADGQLVKAGGPTVKNVSGFDVCRLLVGSRGTLGFLGDVILRTRPIAQHSQWHAVETDEPGAVFADLYRPAAVLWNGVTVWALLEGHPADVAAEAAARGLVPVEAPPTLPAERVVVAPAEQLSIGVRLEPRTFVAELGVGVMHVAPGVLPVRPVEPGVIALRDRIKARFDPTGRLNPGVVVG
ncbi:MAG: FAD-binding oxidoreductase [Ilumatobacteraceae bacterium]